MNHQIRYTKIESSPALLDYIEAKLVVPLGRFAEASGHSEAWQMLIEAGRETMHHRKGDVWFAEVTGSTSYGPVRVRAEASEMHEAIDLCEEELKATLSKSKGRMFSKGLRAARRVKNMIRFSRFARFLGKGRNRDESI
jgi:ribosome-associated translation inhibitor RaiA